MALLTKSKVLWDLDGVTFVLQLFPLKLWNWVSRALVPTSAKIRSHVLPKLAAEDFFADADRLRQFPNCGQFSSW